MTIEKHPAVVALEKLRDYPEICEALAKHPHQFRQYARPIIDAYFAPLGEKLCRPPCRLPTEEGWALVQEDIFPIRQ
ncbi:MAG: hypothetical protein V4724_26835 [Pseudomonadota bacterium]